MSGEVRLIDGGDHWVSRLVRAASTLFGDERIGRAALVGGVAVTIRLATVHRATIDVDVVSSGEAGALALDYVGGDEAGGSERFEIDGVTVDVIRTDALPAESFYLPDDELQRLFVLGHRWALDCAQPVDVEVITGRTVLASARLVVATAPALLACKLHAIADRREARADKRQSDAVDLVRLAENLVPLGNVSSLYTAAPFDLASLVDGQIRRWFIDEPQRTARLVNAELPGLGRIDAAHVATLGSLLVAQ